MESALNQTAEQLGQNFAEIENRRQELATMLDSMQEAVVAVTAEGQGPPTQGGFICAVSECFPY